MVKGLSRKCCCVFRTSVPAPNVHAAARHVWWWRRSLLDPVWGRRQNGQRRPVALPCVRLRRVTGDPLLGCGTTTPPRPNLPQLLLPTGLRVTTGGAGPQASVRLVRFHELLKECLTKCDEAQALVGLHQSLVQDETGGSTRQYFLSQFGSIAPDKWLDFFRPAA